MRRRQKPKRKKRKLVPGIRFSPRLSPVVTRALDHIEENLLSIGSTTDISEAVGVSREHLSRTFSQETGVKLWSFVNMAKVERAKEFLKDGTRGIKQMYSELGFGCQSTFYNAFRAYAGTTPGAFRVRKLGKKRTGSRARVRRSRTGTGMSAATRY
ncbi:MAG: helix-turn-helix transcriptional regulator [Candidatus Eiseniibacteriota bacterium]|nr:MAG: helix-turn-helix transcriptional regulator [Candidatus Eisenbacteria bacterium]